MNCLATNPVKTHTGGSLPFDVEQHREGDEVLLGEACVVD